MKKKLLVLGMALICIFGMTACSGTAETVDYGITDAEVIQYADSVVESIRAIVDQGAQAQYKDDVVVTAALSSWEGAQEDIGEILSTGNHTVAMDADGVTVNVAVDGSVHDAVVEVILDEELVLTSVTTNVKYSFGELMTNAALNTLIGMGTVFVVLILICLLIYCFAFIPRIQAAFSGKKNDKPAPAPAPAPAAAPAPVAEEELVDDYELVAVIAAAIAASEGAASADGFQVRSIRRSSKWKSR